VHLYHGSTPYHFLPHWYIFDFGNEEVKFDMFMVLPCLVNRNANRTKGNLHNFVQENHRKAFMEKCLLPAIKKVVPPSDFRRQAWQLDYAIADANSTAAAKEGDKYVSGQTNYRRARVDVNLQAEYVSPVWEECKELLNECIQTDSEMKIFEGYEFFMNAKGCKYELCAERFSEAVKKFEKKVKPYLDLTYQLARWYLLSI
jgi:hypothetical protein